MTESDDARYPIGRFVWDPEPDEARRAAWIDAIRTTPAALRDALAAVTDPDRPVRPGAWTIRQLVHHLADAHMNLFCRFKFALTEESPHVKPFDEDLWVQTPDALTGPIEPSLAILDGVHARWAFLLEHMGEDDFNRTVAHPMTGTQTLDRMLQYFAWHGPHHIAQIRAGTG